MQFLIMGVLGAILIYFIMKNLAFIMVFVLMICACMLLFRFGVRNKLEMAKFKSDVDLERAKRDYMRSGTVSRTSVSRPTARRVPRSRLSSNSGGTREEIFGTPQDRRGIARNLQNRDNSVNVQRTGNSQSRNNSVNVERTGNLQNRDNSSMNVELTRSSRSNTPVSDEHTRNLRNHNLVSDGRTRNLRNHNPASDGLTRRATQEVGQLEAFDEGRLAEDQISENASMNLPKAVNASNVVDIFDGSRGSTDEKPRARRVDKDNDSPGSSFAKKAKMSVFD